MTRYMLAILSLPLAVLVGCGDSFDDCDGAKCGDEFATLHLQAPYEWAGDWRVYWDEDTSDEEVTEHLATDECEVEVRAPGKGRVSLWGGDLFRCVIQPVSVSAEQAGKIVEVLDQWTGEGVCFLIPDGEYSGMNVWTTIDDENGSDQGWIGIGSSGAVITGSSFFYEGEDYVLEGSVSDDLTSIDYYLGAPGTSGGDRDTIYLEE